MASGSSTIDIPDVLLTKVRKFRLTPSKAPITAQVYKIDKKTLTLELEDELLTGLTCVEDLVEGKRALSQLCSLSLELVGAKETDRFWVGHDRAAGELATLPHRQLQAQPSRRARLLRKHPPLSPTTFLPDPRLTATVLDG